MITSGIKCGEKLHQSSVKLDEIQRSHSPPRMRCMIEFSVFPMLPSIVKYKQTIHEEAERRGGRGRLIYKRKYNEKESYTPFASAMPLIQFFSAPNVQLLKFRHSAYLIIRVTRPVATVLPPSLIVTQRCQ
jgi:hypothetical protein